MTDKHQAGPARILTADGSPPTGSAKESVSAVPEVAALMTIVDLKTDVARLQAERDTLAAQLRDTEAQLIGVRDESERRFHAAARAWARERARADGTGEP